MKIKVFYSLLFLLIGFSLQAQKSKSTTYNIGLKISQNYFLSSSTLRDNKGLSLEYNQNYKNTKHYWASGLGLNITQFTSELQIEGRENPNNIYPEVRDVVVMLDIPAHYMYRPFSWCFLRTGINNKIAVKNTTRVDNVLSSAIPAHRRFAMEYHLGTDFQFRLKNIQMRVGAYMNYGLFSRQYLERGVNLGFFFEKNNH